MLAEWLLGGFERLTGRRPKPGDLMLPALTIEQLRDQARAKRLANGPDPVAAHGLEAEGLSFAEIGARMGCSEATAFRAVRRFEDPQFRANEPVSGLYGKPTF
jgi:Homeodomain-like domain-containing protein